MTPTSDKMYISSAHEFPRSFRRFRLVYHEHVFAIFLSFDPYRLPTAIYACSPWIRQYYQGSTYSLYSVVISEAWLSLCLYDLLIL